MPVEFWLALEYLLVAGIIGFVGGRWNWHGDDVQAAKGVLIFAFLWPVFVPLCLMCAVMLAPLLAFGLGDWLRERAGRSQHATE